MEQTLRRLGRNLRWLLWSEALGRAIGFGTMAVMARSFGLERFGLFTLTFTFVELFQQLVSLSSHEVIVRRVAADPSRLRATLSGMLTLQGLTLALGILVSIGIGAAYGGELAWMIPAGAAIGSTRGLTTSFLAVAAAHDDFRPASLNAIWRRLAVLAGLLAFLFADSSMAVFWLAFLLGEVMASGMAVIASRDHGSLSGWEANRRSELAGLLREGLSFSTLRWSGLLHTRLDIFLIERMLGAEAVGLYGAAYRLLDVFKTLPNLLEATLLPIFSRLLERRSELSEALIRSVKAMATVALPIGVGAWMVSHFTIRIVFGEDYAGAAEPWTVLMVAFVLTSTVRPVLVLLRAQKRLAAANLAAWVSVAVNLALNLVLIPRYGIIGAALATAASEGAFTLFAARLARGHLEVARLLRHLWPCLGAALAMGVAGWAAARMNVVPVAAGLAAAGVYLVVLFLGRGLDEKDRDGIRLLIKG